MNARKHLPIKLDIYSKTSHIHLEGPAAIVMIIEVLDATVDDHRTGEAKLANQPNRKHGDLARSSVPDIIMRGEENSPDQFKYSCIIGVVIIGKVEDTLCGIFHDPFQRSVSVGNSFWLLLPFQAFLFAWHWTQQMDCT